MSEVQRLVPSARVMKYGGLARFRSLPPLPLIVLYETKPNFGHWVAVLRTPEGVEVFDSYGILPDNELNWVPPWLKPSTGQDTKRLMRFLYDSGEQVNYNNHRLQGKDSSTCGRWCALRIWLAGLTNNGFYRAVKDTARFFSLSPDEMVAEAVRA